MKVIDLFNEIAKGVIPKRIIYKDVLYNWNTNDDDYEDNDYNYFLGEFDDLSCLKDEVEIIKTTEDEDLKKKIYKLENPCCFNEIIDKVNEIIDKVNKE